jgi:ribosomal protein S18 acetylase RimI-like enzyme
MKTQPTDRVVVRSLTATDIVGVAQCIVLDADAFPYASVAFGLRATGAQVWVARTGDEPRVVGFVASAARLHERYVEALAVEGGLRRRGIGRALMHAAIAGARGAHPTRLSLHVWVGNMAAIELYRSMGFAERRRVRHFYRPGLFEGSDDAYEMAYAEASSDS